MRRLIACSLFLGLAGLLLGADDPFVGTWKLNLEKSNLGPSQPGKAIKEQTLVIKMTKEEAIVAITGTREDGSPASTKYSMSVHGGPVTYDPPMPASVSVTSKRVNARTVDLSQTRDGKEVFSQHNVVSADGKTLRATGKGTNAQGQTMETVFVWDKQ